jgi:hypothetical protein
MDQKAIYNAISHSIRTKCIAIDTEYYCHRVNGYAPGKIKRVFCVCATVFDEGENRKNYTKWLNDGEKITLREIADALNIQRPVFICHGLEIAERRAFIALGDNPDAFDWIDLYTIVGLIYNTSCGNVTPKHHSLVDITKYFLNIDIDQAYKAQMQGLCIQNATEGYEKQIVEYCLEDCQHLHELCAVMLSHYAVAIEKSYKLSNYKRCGIVQRAIDLTRSVIEFARIADRGLPVHPVWTKKLKENAPKYINNQILSFRLKYPETYKSKDNKHTRNNAKIQEFLKKEIEAGHLYNYPRTNGGDYSITQDTLAAFFGDKTDSFGHDLMILNQNITKLRGICGDWLDNFNEKDAKIYYNSLRLFASATGRCQPDPSAGFVFGWDKSLYGIINPAPGHALIELDYTAEEIFIQSAIYNDKDLQQYYYMSKDIYCNIATVCGLIPRDEYNILSPSELKTKYKKERNAIKIVMLAQSYGAGQARLADAVGDADTANAITDTLDRIFPTSQKMRQKLAIDAAITRGLCMADGHILRTRPDGAETAPAKSALINAPIQATGAQILRRIVHLSDLAGLSIVATIHDAVLIDCMDSEVDAVTAQASKIMQNAARDVLGTAGIKIGAPEIIRHGIMWDAGGKSAALREIICE